jgi:hypothetical protein
VFDSPLGPTQRILLLSLQSVIEASINIIHHMDLSVKGKRGPLRFWPDNKSLEQICRDISSIDLKPTLHRRSRHQERETLDFVEIEECSEWEQMSEEQDLVNLAIQYVETADLVVEEVYMTEIQLRRIVDRTTKDQQLQQSDGDETMTKNGKTISKFSKEAMNIGDDALEHEVVLRKVYLVYDKGRQRQCLSLEHWSAKDHDQIQGQTVQL